MKRLIPILFFLLIIQNSAFPWNKEEARDEIKKTQKALIILDNNLDMRPYIPYDIYSDGLIELLNARTEFENENYPKALFLAVMSGIKLETVLVLAEAKSYRDKIIIMERDYFKKYGSSKGEENKGLLGSILDAGLMKKGDSYRIVLLDKNLFKKEKFILSDRGVEALKKIIAVLNADPGASVKIAGHTSTRDYKEYSKYKADVVSKFLKKSGIGTTRISTYGLGNTEVLETPWGFRHLDSVEIVVSVNKKEVSE